MVSCDIIRDSRTGQSLQYAFIGFKKKEECEAAYFKMQNVLVDDRRLVLVFTRPICRSSSPVVPLRAGFVCFSVPLGADILCLVVLQHLREFQPVCCAGVAGLQAPAAGKCLKATCSFSFWFISKSKPTAAVRTATACKPAAESVSVSSSFSCIRPSRGPGGARRETP